MTEKAQGKAAEMQHRSGGWVGGWVGWVGWLGRLPCRSYSYAALRQVGE